MTLEELLGMLTSQKYKHTKQRERFLQLFIQSDHSSLSARQIKESFRSQFETNVSYDTIYKNLTLFTELGILDELMVEGERRYHIACLKNHDHHHHIICTACGKTDVIHFCPMDYMSTYIGNGYKVTNHKFEIYGMCPDCQEQKATA